MGENACERRERKPGLEFNPGLTLIIFQTTGPCL